MFWSYENLKATHETLSIGAVSSRIVKLQLSIAFCTFKQGPKEDIADYMVLYDRKEVQLLAYGVPIKLEVDRALHFIKSLNNSTFGRMKSDFRRHEALVNDM